MKEDKIKQSAELIAKEILMHERSEHAKLMEEVSIILVRKREYHLSTLFRGISEMHGIGK